MRDGIDSVKDLIAAPRGRGEWLMRNGKWFIILPPMLYLLVFFLIPFAFALKISFEPAGVAYAGLRDRLAGAAAPAGSYKSSG
jgi:ABC-type spermidine/putrescine transport system permease subunit I